MKKVLLLMVSALVLFGCKSKEEKAAELIKKEMFKTLYDFESYQPIETKVDSAFYSAYTDSIILKHAYLTNEVLKEANKTIADAKDAQQTMDIWGSDSYSSYGQSKYYDAKEKADAALSKAKIYIKLMNSESDTIKQLAQKIKPDFYGWKVTHKFRCKTKGGNSTIGDYIYIFDKNMKHIIYKEDTEDEELTKVKGLIKEAIEKNDSIKSNNE